MCVGGDGIVHEVVNGLLEKSHGNVGIDLVDGTVSNNFTALPLNMRVGVIPAGWLFFFQENMNNKKKSAFISFDMICSLTPILLTL